MFKVQAPSDCGNAPKKKFLIEFQIALAEGKLDVILDQLAEDIIWETIGSGTLNGQAQVKLMLEELIVPKFEQLEVLQIITHGKEASMRGVWWFETKRSAFASFFEFSSAGSRKIKRISWYCSE